MELILVRHGQTDYNVEKRFQGRLDIALNATGVSQAHAMRVRLQEELAKVIRIYSSPLKRARQTAGVIAGEAIPVESDHRLIEIDLGQFDGRLEQEIADELGPQQYNAWRDSCFVTSAPGGESLAEAMQRCRMFLDCIAVKYREPTSLAVVSHQGLLLALKAAISKRFDSKSLKSYRQSNDEIEFWDVDKACRIRQIRVDPAVRISRAS